VKNYCICKMDRNKNFKLSNSEKINIINTCVATYATNVKYMLMQFTTQFLHLFNKRRRHLVEVILQNLLNKTPPNQLFNIGPVLRLSQEREIWMKNRSKDWWERIVNQHYKEDDWLESFRMEKNTFMWLCGPYTVE